MPLTEHKDTRGIHCKRINNTSIQSSLSTHPPLSFHSLNDDLKKKGRGIISYSPKKGTGPGATGIQKTPPCWFVHWAIPIHPSATGHTGRTMHSFSSSKKPRDDPSFSRCSLFNQNRPSLIPDQQEHTIPTMNIPVYTNDLCPDPLFNISCQFVPLFVLLFSESRLTLDRFFFFYFFSSLLLCYQNPTTMSFNRFVQIGRVCLINYGDDEGKLCTIIDVVDSGRALVDGPTKITGVTRQIVPFKRLSLTDYVVKIGRNARQKSLNKAWATDDIKGKWDASAWAKKRAAAKKRATTNDFGRFRAMLLKKKRTQMVKKAAAALRK